MWNLQMLHEENQIVNPFVYEFQSLWVVRICFTARFSVLMLVNVMTAVLKDVKPCSVVDISNCFRGACCLHLQGTSELPYFLLMLILVWGYGNRMCCWHFGGTFCFLTGVKVRKSVQVLRAGRRLANHKITFFSINLGDWNGCFFVIFPVHCSFWPRLDN
jgi:hypothetical protein